MPPVTPDLSILGICGTFMGGLAALGRESGLAVAGCDASVYPPMSTQLEALGIRLHEGYGSDALGAEPGLVVVGNAMKRGMPVVEVMLQRRLAYVSGPEWLARRILPGRRTLAVAGTHGKTTTSSLLAWIFEACGAAPGFLIGGVPGNFAVSARLGQGPAFIVEADEYDSAYFDKRAKFVHYRPEIALLNNLEFDHADIYDELAQIERQFHHLVRTVPPDGCLIVNGDDPALERVLTMGCWSRVQRFSLERPDTEWRARLDQSDGSGFTVFREGQALGAVRWGLCGRHNVANALGAVAAAVAYGLDGLQVLAALPGFRPPRRRLEQLASRGRITLYDDFAHHPTAISSTLAGLRARVGSARILVALEARSATMRRGVHRDELADSLAQADGVYALTREGQGFDWSQVLAPLGARHRGVARTAMALAERIAADWQPGDHLVLMSNGSFDGLSALLKQRLESSA
ncbi:MAG: UDP-N-acetylmuramate:L-alanyl-gamma-D-glutamyl-meso-diaminopimelate ligase [Xanthomonadales bacterium]|jgi:UDP-N-acetylmuramate: L-alanyl-gamma-D-glutamyl-meso-diaminopimelate ligase|nr:UDP-N-acetylmuramate:L-alanyl-gamma-D-glutamyl-meso-diaminopimelate ligase [Xanthomonadales bacterium]